MDYFIKTKQGKVEKKMKDYQATEDMRSCSKDFPGLPTYPMYYRWVEIK